MKTKTIRIVSAVAALLLLMSVFTVFTMNTAKAAGSKTDGKMSASPKEGAFGRTVTVSLTMPSDDTVTYSYDILVDGTSIDSGTGASHGAPITKTFSTTKESHKVSATITADDSTPCPIADIEVISKKPVIKASSPVTYQPGLTINVTIENPMDAGSLTVTDPDDAVVTASGSGASWTFPAAKAGEYTIDYGDGTIKAEQKKVTVAKAPANLSITESKIKVLAGNASAVNFKYDSDATAPAVTITPSTLATAGTPTKTNASITAGANKGTGTIKISVAATTNYLADEKSIPLEVYDSTTPMITASPNPINMDKNTPTQKVTITLTNPKVDSSGYAKVVAKMTGPSNAYNGVYIDGYHKKAGNTYAVAVSGSTTSFDVTLKARRSATYYLQIQNGDEILKVPVKVTGFSNLPQTGPDFTLVYVFAGLLLLAGAGLVVVSVLKKKNNGVN